MTNKKWAVKRLTINLASQEAQREHVNFARTDELLKSGRINENRGRNQF